MTDPLRDRAALHRKGLISTAELHAVIGPAPVPAATQATDGTACTCGERLPIHHLHADQHQPKEGPCTTNR